MPIYLDFLRPNWDLLQKCNFGSLAGNWTYNPVNLVRCSANWAMKAIAESMATSSLFIRRAHWLIEENIQKHSGTSFKCLLLVDKNWWKKYQVPIYLNFLRPNWDIYIYIYIYIKIVMMSCLSFDLSSVWHTICWSDYWQVSLLVEQL